MIEGLFGNENDIQMDGADFLMDKLQETITATLKRSFNRLAFNDDDDDVHD